MRFIIISLFQEKVERGVEVYVDEISRRLKAEVISGDLKPYSIFGLTRRFYLDQTSLLIRKKTQDILSKLKPPDILYPVNNGWQSLLCKQYCLKYKTKLLIAGHSGPGWDDRVNLLLNPDVFLTFSQTQAFWAKRHSRGVRVVTIPHGVDINQFKPGKSPLKLNLPHPIFVTVSALSPQGRAGETAKNIDQTIQAVSRLKQGSLLLIGSGPEQDRIDNLGKKLLGPRYLRITTSHNKINQYYRQADVFTLASSRSEAFGLSYLEALASGLPVVAFDDPLRREIIGVAGIYFKDFQDYSNALSQSLKTKWGNRPRSQAEKYSWDKIIPQYQNLCQSLL